ncbi:non-hydrolyzing UDP-N-acetylglucosamine 2-epimerase [Aurantibacillus circumpalustris]|uniref:non-hydrolyzing UDP-N-acetylglucosamine 2-epimerase n=1 Tax=Aurantibacillus circumpalustris TaxID=3036359 RepID=UPI00295AAC02|nr:UDP-N-acetylglucosamine 2-epimerase (non-hydrolyzing) [Aurantibacillus circumpalustris]
MLKLVTIIGARPQIIKAAALSRAIKNNFSSQLQEIIVHTGQHYDANMSQVFFDELGIPAPNYNLNVGSGNHGKQTAIMLAGIEEVLVKEQPNAIVLYGDTNSTLAGAIAASKIHVPVVHIEAGLRSYSKAMPEEVNRIMCDHVSTFLFSPTKTGFDNLVKEGFNKNAVAPFTADNPKIYHCGDVMYDNSLYFSSVSESKTNILEKLKLKKNKFILATIHRNNNTDEPLRLNSLFKSLQDISVKHNLEVVLPLHPRTAKLIETNLDKDLYAKIKTNTKFKITEPASFLEMVALEKNCKLVMTDSGGVQKEAFYFEKPCVILRPETEWVELVECGAAIVTDADESRIKDAFEKLNSKTDLKFPKLYGDGKAAEFICNELVHHL